MDSTTRGKSIFDIPKPLPTSEELKAIQKPKRRRRKKKIVKKPKVAKAGGVEVSQTQNVKGQKEITLKHKGGLTQQITIYTGDQKPRGIKAKGQTASWNMKPAKFKRSRGLRDDRVYLQPPKREYFGNRYKSALDKIKIDQKVREAGLLKNKEVEAKKERADREVREVRDRQQRERLQLAQRERAKDATIEELRREKAGVVASHNVSNRNQSRATILGGDVGELNKLIARRGYNAIEFLVRKGEISDQSTILQLDLDPAQIQKLIQIRTAEEADFGTGARITYLSGTGQPFEGVVLSESEKFVTLQRDDGSKVRVPKTNIQSGQRVAEVRSQSRDPSVRRGRRAPTAEDFGSPRPAGSSAEERPAFRRDRVSAEQRQQKRREETPFEERLRRQAQPQPVELTAEEQEEIRFKIYEGLTGANSRSINRAGGSGASLEKALAEAEATSPPAGERTIDELRLELPSDESESALLEESLRQSRERELQRPQQKPQPEPEPTPEPEPVLQPESQSEEAVTAETLSSEEEQRAIETAQQTPRQFFEGLSKRTPRGELFEAELTSRQRKPDDPRTGVGFTFLRQTPRNTAQIRRETAEAKFGGALADILEPTEPTSSGGETAEYTEADLKELVEEVESDRDDSDDALAVDNRESSKRTQSDGDEVRPAKTFTFRQIKRRINFVYKDDPAIRGRLERKLNRAKKLGGVFRVEDAKLLDALGL